jgi:hypothetical protein
MNRFIPRLLHGSRIGRQFVFPQQVRSFSLFGIAKCPQIIRLQLPWTRLHRFSHSDNGKDLTKFPPNIPSNSDNDPIKLITKLKEENKINFNKIIGEMHYTEIRLSELKQTMIDMEAKLGAKLIENKEKESITRRIASAYERTFNFYSNYWYRPKFFLVSIIMGGTVGSLWVITTNYMSSYNNFFESLLYFFQRGGGGTIAGAIGGGLCWFCGPLWPLLLVSGMFVFPILALVRKNKKTTKK